MSDDEDTMMNGGGASLDEKEPKPQNGENSSTSDDDSSSSSSGSSSSSDSSDSESDGEDGGNGGEARRQQQQQRSHDEENFSERKYSIESVASSNGLAASSGRSGAAEPLNVNSNRAAARFREQNSEVGLMALGTKKRDRRTIEEIQRDLLKKRGRSSLLSSSNGSSSSSRPPIFSSSGLGARASPPKGSPALSPEPPGSDSSQLAVGLPQMKMPKGKPNSARSRLTAKIFGRGRSNPTPATKPAATTKKPSAASASTSSSAGASGMVTNISAGAKNVKPASSPNDLDSYVAEQRVDHASARQLEPRIEPKVVDWKPDPKVVRALLRSMLRFGDLTDVNLFTTSSRDDDVFADEYKLPNFVVRSNLPASTKVPEERLLKTASEIAERTQRAIEEKQDSMKFAEVEVKPSQIIERLYENLKLRVAVQRALRDIRYKKDDNKGAYLLVGKHVDLPTLGISRDFPAWSWAEKEHDWTSKKDAALLLGIYVHGFGAWEDILNDELMHFSHQRALKGERMKKRAENLLKRLPSPDDSGDPRIVQLANALIAGAQNPGQSLGAQFSAIINNNGSGNSGGNNSSIPSSKGRMHRAAERFAARQSTGGSSDSRAAPAAPEDSIRRSNTQSSSSGSTSVDRHRKPSVASPPAATAAANHSDNEPEDGQVGAKMAPKKRSSSSSSKRSSSSVSASTTKRSASIEREAPSNGSPRKKSKRSSSERSSSRKEAAAAGKKNKKKKKQRVILSEEECYEKWKPSKRLKDIRQVLKKMKIMAEWSKNQKDEVVVEKVFKYVTTIGEAIDEIVQRVEKKEGDKFDQHEWDELCSSLWAYAAGYTPFSSVLFERLYDDICADGDSLRQHADKPRRSSAST